MSLPLPWCVNRLCPTPPADSRENAATIPIDRHLIFSPDSPMVDKTKMHHIDDIANRTKADIFLLDPEKKQEDGSFQTASKEPLKVMVYGDMLTKENAKIRILVMIDQIVQPTPRIVTGHC